MSEETKKPRYTQKAEVIDGVTHRYFADGINIFSKGKEKQGKEVGYWEWYRQDGTLKRSGYFDAGEPVGEWTTYDAEGRVYKVTER
jgi:antitoxin component YwqK of YwqJK toxin-antitoxin module